MSHLATADLRHALRATATAIDRAERAGDHDAAVRHLTDLEQLSVLLEGVMRDERDDDRNVYLLRDHLQVE
jgi:hypothetical protein